MEMRNPVPLSRQQRPDLLALLGHPPHRDPDITRPVSLWVGWEGEKGEGREGRGREARGEGVGKDDPQLPSELTL